MTSVAKTPAKNADRLVELFHQILNGLPMGTATVVTERTKNDDGTIVWLKPTNQRASEFSAHVEDCHPGLIDVSFGSRTTLELPWEAKLPSETTFETMLAMVRDMAYAVVAGRCEERFGLLRIRGTIHIDAEHSFHCTYILEPHVFPRTVHYEPYLGDSQAERPPAGTPL
jgi:hypothetical protein